MNLETFIKNAHANACAKGFWDQPRNKGEMIALMHSELSEMLEATRAKNMQPSEHIPNFTAEEEEAADLLIRLADYCGGWGLRLNEAVQAKMAFNKGREKMHGKRF